MSIGLTSSIGTLGAVVWLSYRSGENSFGMIFKLQLASLAVLDLVRTRG
jgi:hypothetical protein